MYQNLKKRLYIIFATLHFLVSFIYDKKFFDYSKINVVCVISNMLFFAVLLFIYYKLIKIVKNFKSYKFRIRIFLIYMSIMLAFFILTYPGVWRWDDMENLYYARYFLLYGWQHIFSTIYDIICLKFLPFASGIVLIQNIIISIIVSVLVDDVFKVLKNNNNFKIKYLWILFIPFLLPTTIDHNLYTIRLVMYSYVLLITIYFSIKYLKANSIQTKSIMWLTFGYFILCNYRTEGFCFCIAYFILILYLYKKQFANKFLLIALSLFLLVSMPIIKHINSKCSGDSSQYTIISTLEPIAPLIRKENSSDGNSYILKKINKVLDIQYIIDEPKKAGIDIFYEHNYIKYGYTKADYREYLKAYFQLIFKYPNVFFNERNYTFVATNGLIKNVQNSGWNTSNLFDKGVLNNQGINIMDVVKVDNKLFKPINNDIRKRLTRLIEGGRLSDYYQTTFITPLFWNSIPSIIIILIVILFLLFRSNIIDFAILGSVLIRTVIVYLTAPGKFFMYYFPEYLLGYFLLFGFIVFYLNNKKAKIRLQTT